MSVTHENQIWLQWERCEDGYQWIEDEVYGTVLSPKSGNFVPIFPLVEDLSLFGQFSDLKTPDDFQKFANKFGLLGHRRENDLISHWETGAESMGAAFRTWKDKGDFKTLMEFFNFRSSEKALGLNVGTVRLRLELLPKRTTPVLFMEPNNLLLAMWAQFAHVLTHNKHQKRCENPKCGKWFSSLTKRKLTCSNACKQEVWRKNPKRKEKGK